MPAEWAVGHAPGLSRKGFEQPVLGAKTGAGQAPNAPDLLNSMSPCRSTPSLHYTQVVGTNTTLEGFESVSGQTGKPVVADLTGGSNVVHIIDTVSG